MKLFSKKEALKVKSIPLDPNMVADPKTAVDYYRRGVAYYARRKYDLAIDDLKQATALDGQLVDGYYSLGMVLKAIRRNEEAVIAFQKVVDFTTMGAGGGKVAANMLRRLALGHINMLTQGDWNLEKEIWKHID